jgi:hypothetical protein
MLPTLAGHVRTKLSGFGTSTPQSILYTTMFPPIDEAMLQNNPRFAALHKTLTTRILNPDGSSKSPAAADREAAAETLKAHRTRAAKTEIIRAAMTTLPITEQKPPLPPELIELMILLTHHLNTTTQLTPSSLALLKSTPLYGSLPAHLPRISALLSPRFHTQALALTRLLHPTTNASFLHRTIPKIPSMIQSQLEALHSKKSDLETRRLALVPLICHVLEAYRTATELAIRALEQNKHGSVARGAKARSEMLLHEAKVLELDTEVLNGNVVGMVYTEEVKEALENYRSHLRDGRSRLRQRQRDAERELERYGVGREKEGLMREIARVYGEMGRQVEEVRRDVERLRNA